MGDPGLPLVLVVDDDIVFRETARLLLEEEGYSAEVVGGGAPALDRLRAQPTPSVILLDLEMPGVDGFAVLRTLERSATLSAVPVIAMTAADGTVSTSTLRYPLLRKPFGMHALMREIAIACPRLWDPDEPPTREDVEPPTERAMPTSRDRCVVCGGAGSTRCTGCGQAFCRECLDAGPDGRCAACWRST